MTGFGERPGAYSFVSFGGAVKYPTAGLGEDGDPTASNNMTLNSREVVVEGILVKEASPSTARIFQLDNTVGGVIFAFFIPAQSDGAVLPYFIPFGSHGLHIDGGIGAKTSNTDCEIVVYFRIIA